MNNDQIRGLITKIRAAKEWANDGQFNIVSVDALKLALAELIMIDADDIITILEKEIKENAAMEALNNKIKAAQFIYEIHEVKQEIGRPNRPDLPKQPTLLDEINRLAEEHRKSTQEAKAIIEEQQKRGWEDGW